MVQNAFVLVFIQKGHLWLLCIVHYVCQISRAVVIVHLDIQGLFMVVRLVAFEAIIVVLGHCLGEILEHPFIDCLAGEDSAELSL